MNINATDLTADTTKLIELVQQSRSAIDIVDDSGKVIARIVPGEDALEALPEDGYTRTKNELEKLIADIAPYLPEQVDAVQITREIRE